jgi:hypothetical protein
VLNNRVSKYVKHLPYTWYNRCFIVKNINSERTFRRNMLPKSSGSINKPNKKIFIILLSRFGFLTPKKSVGTDELFCSSLLFAKQPWAPRGRIALLATSFMLVSCLVYSFTLKMKATCSSEMSVDFQRRYIPENRTLHNHLCENPKFYI